MTVSINRKATDLFDSVEDSSYLNSCLKPECSSTPTKSEDVKETPLGDRICAQSGQDYSSKQNEGSGINFGKNSIRNASHIRVITNDDILVTSRRIDRILSFLNEDEIALLSKPKISETVQVSTSFWTTEKLTDMICQNLCQVNIIIEHNGETLGIPKYSERVVDLAPIISVYRPTPELTISLSDLDKGIILRLHKLEKKERSEILQRVGKKLFKTFFPHYYNVVADLVKIRIKE